MGGFSQGFSSGLGLAQQQTAVNEQQKTLERDAQAKLYENALNNPGISPGQRQQLLQGYTGLFAPHEAPNLIERLSGLIHGTAKAAGKAHQGIADALTGPSAPPAVGPPQPAPANGAAPTDPNANPASVAAATSTPAQSFGIGSAPISASAGASTSPTSLPPAAHALPTGVPGALVPTPQESAAAGEPPLHPMATAHPFLDRLNAGIKEIGDHLHGFAQPKAPQELAPGTGELLASAYESPETVKLREMAAANKGALAVQEARTKSLLAGIHLRDQIGTPEKDAISSYMAENGIDDPNDVPFDVRTDLHRRFGQKGLTTTTANPDGTFSKEIIDPQTGKPIVSADTVAPRGLYGTSTASSTTDSIGNVSTTNRTTRPLITHAAPGAPTSSAAPASPASLSALQSKVNGNRTSAAFGAATAPRTPRSSNAPSGKLPALDESGHIPANYGNKMVTEAANELLDGIPLNQIKGKGVSERAGALARQFGWQQGMLTPKEFAQVNVATTFLKKAQGDPSLNVLDNTESRVKLQQLIGTAPKSGEDLKRILAINVSASNLNPQEQAFLRMYQRLAGTIQGVSSLTRSGKMTEAGVDRLVTELPNPWVSTSASDGRERLGNLLEEVDTFKGSTAAAQNAKGGGPVSSNAPGAKGSLADRLNAALSGK